MVPAPRTDQQSPLWPIFGHGWAVALLRHTLSAKPNARGPRHAYLFTGPRHIGKTTLAHFLAQTLLCTVGSDIACGRCRACRLMEHGNHVDFRFVQPINKDGEVDRASGILRVGQAVEIIRDVSTHPAEGRYKIFLLQDVHRANDNFTNKVLKTLEEPAPRVILLLTADDRSNLLPTLVSRCQVLPLRTLDMPTVCAALESEWKIDAERAELLARLANGCLGWAVQQVDRSSFFDERNDSLSTLLSLVTSARTVRLAFAERLAAQRDMPAIFQLLDLWITWWRDVMLLQTSCKTTVCNIDQLPMLGEHAQNISPATVRQYLILLRQIDRYLHHTVNLRLACDVLLLQLPHITE